MKHSSYFRLFLILLVTAGLMTSTACARQPSPKRTTTILHHHFKSYGRHYKETDFGQHRIQAIDILSIEEIHKDLVAVIADVALIDGPTIRVRAHLEKKSFGWKLKGWEQLSSFE